MLYPELEEKLRRAEHNVRMASSENILERCKQYLALLGEYRTQLYELQGGSATTRTRTANGDLTDRKTIRAAIERTTEARNKTEKLLLSFTTVSAYEAVELFNRVKHKGHDDWELRASGVKFLGGNGEDLITIQEATQLAGLLRRQEYISEQLKSVSS
jgi:hypothetical protein